MFIRSISFLLFSGLACAAASFPVLTYSTYLRDSFTPTAIATDSSGNIYMAGNAIVDPATSQTTVLVVKLNPQGTLYLYVRYLGGSVNDNATALTVDSAGNAYIAGSTRSPDFPVTNRGILTASASQNVQRSFVAKLDPTGDLVFSDLLGGSALSTALAVAVSATGQVVVTGLVSGLPGSAFPTTAGAYSVSNTANHPYLLELDPTGAKIIFSATGIGGSALALDSSGNIYVSGATNALDYPTTPGTYQSTFPAFLTCIAPCHGSFQGQNQYVTKVDPTGSKLIYSAAVSGTGNTSNSGLAVDAAGNVYLTGYAGPNYPYTVTPPKIMPGPTLAIWALPFLTKLDPAGQTLLFSVPVGGTGVQVDSIGAVYVAGALGGDSNTVSYAVSTVLPAIANVPTQCLPNNILIHNSAFVAQVDGSTGSLLGSQFIGGSELVPTAVALAGSTLWIAGSTSLADFAQTPDTITLPSLTPAPLPGAYLGAVDFAQPPPPSGTPQIGCIIDSANLAAAGPSAPNQVLTILGSGLGPSTGVSASDYATTSLAGVSVNFGSISAPLLYVSATQINFAVPLLGFSQPLAPVKVTVNGSNSSSRQIPLTSANPSVYLNAAQMAVALNTDGTLNSSANPAKLGSGISIFVNGLTPDPRLINSPPQFYSSYGWSITGVTQANPFVLDIALKIPSSLTNNFSCPPPSTVCAFSFSIYDVAPVYAGPQSASTTGQAFGGAVYVTSP